jgi:hypothetical protein
MPVDRQNSALVISQKKGVPVYASNPSIPNPDDIRRRKPVRFGDDKRGFVVDNGNGEVMGVGGMSFYEFEEVDTAKFVKMFLAGIKQAAGLSKAGLAVFELVYTFVQENPNTDRVELSFYGASQQIKGLNDRTYRRGVRELLDREFLFRSPTEGVFFVNIRYMFNGDRLAFVKGYRRKGSSSVVQGELPLLSGETKPPPSLSSNDE